MWLVEHFAPHNLVARPAFLCPLTRHRLQFPPMNESMNADYETVRRPDWPFRAGQLRQSGLTPQGPRMNGTPNRIRTGVTRMRT